MTANTHTPLNMYTIDSRNKLFAFRQGF